MSDDTQTQRRDFAALLVLVIAVAIAEFALIRNRELWLDESHSALLVTLPLRDLMAFVRGDVHPPLYFLALAGWRWLFGDSEMGLRSLSVLAHVLGAPIVFVTAKMLWSRRQAWFATILYLLNPALFFYASEARGYLLATLWITAAIGCVVASEFAKTPNRRLAATIGAAIFSAAAYYTHYVALFVVAALFGVWLFYHIRSRPGVIRVLATGGLTLLLVAPWAPIMLQQRAVKRDLAVSLVQSRKDSSSLIYGVVRADTTGAKHRVVGAAMDVASISGVFPAKTRTMLALLAIPVLVGLLMGAVAASQGAWLASACIAVVVANVVGMLAIGVEARRYLLLSGPFIIGLLVIGAMTLERSRRGRAIGRLVLPALVALNFAGALRVLRTAQPQSTRKFAAIVAHDATPADVVVFANAYSQIPFDYYTSRAGGLRAQEDGFPTAIRSWWSSQPFKGWGSPVATRPELDAFVARTRQRVGNAALWLVLFENEQYDPMNQMPKALLANARSVHDYGTCGEAAPASCEPSGWHVYRIEF